MADLKTQPTGANVNDFIDALLDEAVRRDCRTLVELMRRAAAAEPEMWGEGMVGFGRYRYRYASGRENEFFPVGFAPRKRELVVYLMSGVAPFADLLPRLGKHRAGKGCLSVKRLSDIDLTVLEQIAAAAVRHLKGAEANR